MMKNDNLFVPLDVDILRKYCLWIIFKYKLDPHHQQQNSSRGDLIGGFIDRWINKIPETLIFKKLVDKYYDDEDFEVINDYFIYEKESAKNAPDIIGLKYKNNFYKFATFKEDKWEINENAPFVEVKTFRNTQKLITIPSTQFLENHYYTFVESTVNDLYLLHLFDKKNFLKNDKYYLMFDDYQIFNENNSSIAKNPIDVVKKEKLNNYLEDNLRGYKLIGIYKGEFLKDYSVEVGKTEESNPEKPRYLDSIDKYDYDEIEPIQSENYNYFYKEQSIPILINIEDNSKVYLVEKNESNIILKVNGIAHIYSEIKFGDNSNIINEKLENSFYILNFKNEIRDLTNYYYLNNCKKALNLNFENSAEIFTGILNFYSNEYRNNKFKVIKSENCDFSILNSSKTTFSFSVDDDVEIKYEKRKKEESKDLTKGQHKIKFNQNGSIKEFNENNDEKKFLLSKIDENPRILDIKLDNKNSKIKFITKNKNDFIIKVNGEAHINNQKVKNKFYKIIFKDGVMQKPEKLDSHPILENKNIIELTDDKFYYHRIKDGEKNVPVKIYIGADNGTDAPLIFYENTKNSVFAEVKGKNIYINDKNVSNMGNESEIWKLSFKKFDRSSKKNEYVISKNALIASKKTFEDELINDFDDFIRNYND